MPALGFFDGIHAQGADGVRERKLGHVTFSGGL
jgi:hypothetical protein